VGLARAPLPLPPQPPRVTGDPLPVALSDRSAPALHASCSIAKFRTGCPKTGKLPESRNFPTAAPSMGHCSLVATVRASGRREIAAMIDRVTGNKPLLASIRQDIVERTDGVPLFIEEMTKAVLEAGDHDGAERAVASIPAQSSAIPASLHASLLARLDRLGSAKEVAQIGAVIGREFSHALVAAVARKDEGALQAALDGLAGAGLVFRQGIPPHATYLFKHGLVV
jgi:hypothetical protein